MGTMDTVRSPHRHQPRSRAEPPQPQQQQQQQQQQQFAPARPPLAGGPQNMSRRKQARPVRLLDDEDGGGGGGGSGGCGSAANVAGDSGSASGSDEERGREFADEEPMPSDPEDMVVSGDEDMDEPEADEGGKRLEQVRRHRQDAENNNSLEEENEAAANSLAFSFPAASHVTLEALQNTKVAVAQFAATTMANNADNEAALQELAVLQSTLFTLQHQQVFQLQLIQQLQNQLSLNRQKDAASPATSPAAAAAVACRLPPTPSPPKLPPAPALAPAREPTPVPIQQPVQMSVQCKPAAEVLSIPKPPTPSPPVLASHPPYSSISSSLASTIITNNDPPPSLNEPNTLEMLQRRAQEVLDNASQGLLANNLADELAFRKSGKMSPYDGKSGGRNEPFFKHRCRYCGKVFGSDSALQIHIRSHTGERPFKCNVCGSRFTTKGNLKVHFQRHTAKFPHVKMNPNPIPEHLDKYHPPLLAQLSPGPVVPGMPPHPLSFPPGGPPPFPSALPLYRPPPPPPSLRQQQPMSTAQQQQQQQPQHPQPPPLQVQVHPLAFAFAKDEQELPADLSKPTTTSSSPLDDQRFKREPCDEDDRDRDRDRVTPKQEPDTDRESLDRYPTPSPYDDCSMDSKYSSEEMHGGRDSPKHQPDPDQPENLSITTTTTASPPSSASSGSLPTFGLPGTMNDPVVYNSLLPRPGSNDNSWESLIEVTKTSETSKLQQLVDNIEHKLTDPNQCVICQRVLSCKSALQMHYRTHTGERPFRCRICGRAFTTKGNLKTHMGVHRTKPPMRVLHQCPVCHKKFTNALVLQQHVRLHTGEPTDLTPDQIRAAEIREPPFAAFLAAQFDDDVDDDDLSGADLDDSSTTTTTVDDQVRESSSPLELFGPLGLALGPAVRGNTTCNICYKTFACNSALEIHYRSHTKERPFKCTVCDRGFSTKSSGGGCLCQGRSSAPRRPPKPQSATALNQWSPFCLPGNMKQHMLTHKIREVGGGGDDHQQQQQQQQEQQQLQQQQEPLPLAPPPPPKRAPPPPEELSQPKRPSNPSAGPPPLSTKHLCGVCRKNFSSSSALQIHMRTHTGDKPFRCSVCQKAFTTKGNLKVHMGTHMWSNGASRRGRRMSLELPPRPLPLSPQDSDFLQRRPDLFYPYLPAPFLNGMQQKLNEISVIQGGNGMTSPGGKFPGLLGFGGFPTAPPPPMALSQPASPQPPSTGTGSPPIGDDRNDNRSVWELHYERSKNGDGGSPPLHSSLGAPPRGEGLAA